MLLSSRSAGAKRQRETEADRRGAKRRRVNIYASANNLGPQIEAAAEGAPGSGACQMMQCLQDYTHQLLVANWDGIIHICYVCATEVAGARLHVPAKCNMQNLPMAWVQQTISGTL